MLSTQSGSIRLFRVAGIQVSLHWFWFLALWYFISTRSRAYHSVGWVVAEYIALFAIVLLHEFGHALACRQVGGTANQIVLWPLGGVAYVRAPERPGAHLWSIAAGPLVNVALIPLLFGLLWARREFEIALDVLDFRRLLVRLVEINFGLLVFNLLPIYPLDGGQIVRSLLWFRFGRARSLQLAAGFGFAAIPALAGYAIWRGWIDWLWALFIGGYMMQGCLEGTRRAKMLLRLEQLPRHSGFACPSCHHAPPGGPLWPCRSCGQRYDPFSTHAVCPHCQAAQPAVPCPHCGEESPIEQWSGPRRTGGL